MDDRHHFLLELFDKLGQPLIGVLNQDDSVQNAETLAAMLGLCVKTGLAISQKFNLSEEEESSTDADALRVSLTAFSAQLIAKSYEQNKTLPNDEKLSHIHSGVEQLLNFAENFTPSAEYAQRLQSVQNKQPLFDDTQSQIFYLSAMVPVLNAVAEFSFGQSAATLIQQISEELQLRATSLREALIGEGQNAGEQRFSELMILQTLTKLYAECHQIEMNKLLSLDEDSEQKEPSMDPVWDRLDLRLSMFEALLNAAAPGEAPTQSAPVPPILSDTPIDDNNKTEEKNVENISNDTSPAQENTPSSPMGFFTKKEGSDSAETPPPAEEQAKTTDTIETKDDDTPPAPSQDAAETPPPPPAGGNPMGFFKPGAKKSDDSEG